MDQPVEAQPAARLLAETEARKSVTTYRLYSKIYQVTLRNILTRGDRFPRAETTNCRILWRKCFVRPIYFVRGRISTHETLRATSGVAPSLQFDVDLVARLAREKHVADLLRDSTAAVRVAGRRRQGGHQKVRRIVIARTRVASTARPCTRKSQKHKRIFGRREGSNRERRSPTWRRIVSLGRRCRRTPLCRPPGGLCDRSCRRRWSSADVWCTGSSGRGTRNSSCARRERRPSARPVPSSARPETISRDPSTAAGGKEKREKGEKAPQKCREERGSADIRTSVAKASLFFSPPERTLRSSAAPMRVSLLSIRPTSLNKLSIRERTSEVRILPSSFILA